MVVLSKYIVAFQPIIQSRRRLVRDLLAAVLFFAVAAQAQELKFGDPDLFGAPFGTKIVDVGFQNWNNLNVSTTNKTDWLLLRWKSLDSTAKWLVRVGVPKCKLTDKDFGLVPLSELEVDPACFNWTAPIEVGQTGKYLLKVSGFDYVVQVISEDLFYRSQYRLILQRP